MKNKALQLASVASMIDLFNADNIRVLLSLGFEVDVATNFKEGSITSQERVNEFRQELQHQGIHTFQIPIPRSISRLPSIISSYRMVKKLAEENKYKIVHCHSPIGGVICRLAFRNARKKQGTKVIYTAHGFHFFKGAPLIAWLVYYPIEKFCSRYTDLLITMNQEDYENAKKMNAKQVEYIPGIGVNTEEIRNIVIDRQSIRAEFGFSTDDFVFMSTGQISIRKNHEVVIRALAKISDNSIKYLIVGFGEEETRLKAIVKELGLEERVVFAGYRGDVKYLLHAVDAFVFPSLQEGLPVALMEAMAAGLPIVASKIRGNTDLIHDGEGGYLIEPQNVDGFTEGMMKVIKNSHYEMGKVNYEMIRRFDTAIVRKKMEKIYKGI